MSRDTASAAFRLPAARQTGQLASTSRIDASEVEIGIDSSEHGTQRDEHYENYGANEHCRLVQQLQARLSATTVNVTTTTIIIIVQFKLA